MGAYIDMLFETTDAFTWTIPAWGYRNILMAAVFASVTTQIENAAEGARGGRLRQFS